MDVVLPTPGSYVVAVSGGVDSMALLHLLQHQSSKGDWKWVVAHLDHGIRKDSMDDRKLVQAVAKQHRLPFVYHESRLGPGTSEAEARQARYNFLHGVRRASAARAVMTAHHQDDVLETAIINILRGSGRKGLTSLTSRPGVIRPLLHIPKHELIAYAQDQGLKWHEDSSNQNQAYLRNYVRHRLLSRFDDEARTRLWHIITDLEKTNRQLDTLLVNQLHLQEAAGTIDRRWFNHLPHSVAREVLAVWLRANDIRGFDSKMLERLVVAAKVAPGGQIFPILKGHILEVNINNLALARLER